MLSLKNVKMKPKLLELFLIVGIIPLAFVGFWSSNLSAGALMEKSYGQLEGVRESKRLRLSPTLRNVREIWAFWWRL